MQTKMNLLGTTLLMTATSVMTAGAAFAEEIVLGYVPASLEYPYNVNTQIGFETAAEAAGVKTVVLDPRGSVEKQSNAIDDLLAQGVSGIGFLPLDSVVAEALVDKIDEAGLPVVAIASQVGDPNTRAVDDPYPKLSAFVATDNFQAGYESGLMAAGLLPEDRTGRIAVVEGDPAYAVVKLDNDGFNAALKDQGADYEIVAAQPTDWTPDKGEAVCQNFLTAHPDLDLIFSHADDMAIGCARAIEAANSDVILIATGGGSALGYNAIAAGEMYGSVCTRPQLLGTLMFEALYEAVQNPDTAKARYVTYDMPQITKETLDDCPEQW